ncbi:VCBS domain-containing protein [Vibrio japonicus]|uniref:VCBS domain-containing protein n=1 Tax=Vibrio japonicus TaxID=1824638 RepID=A0ABY5LBL9_9VIBR|nr:VCBS domain-containing protein [Vibrio japonicus]UUM29443.1 VCBS domain-containing protein [Vibrio japonicus]
MLDNGNETVDALNVDETLTETFTVKSEDGTEQVVTITIHGANDGAKITGDDSGSVTEDAAETTATGTLQATWTTPTTGARRHVPCGCERQVDLRAG